MEKKYFGVMLDCSRGAVMNVKHVKKFIDYISSFGYNMLSLYTEDTYEIDGEARFGYLRGRYTKEELKEIDAYAISKGVEVIPCVQTLAHLHQMFYWKEYAEINDCNDILLIGEEKTYELIEKMIKTSRECYSSNYINLGMDEAHFVGLGKYLSKNGYENRFSVLKKHLSRVMEIVKKYDYKPMMWSDMFFRLANDGDYYGYNMTDEARSSAPKDMALIYWDYYHTNYEDFDRLIKAHQTFDNEIWFAGGVWTWSGFTPYNKYSLETMIPAMKALKNNDVKNVFLTMWGDDGKECSSFSVLSSLYKLKKIYDGVTDDEEIKKSFKEITGEDFDAFEYLDAPDMVGDYELDSNPSKYLFYNDLFMGIFDSTIKGTESKEYKNHAIKLKEYAKNSKFGYIFDNLSDLCMVLSLKADMGLRIRKAYKENDKKALKGIVKDIITMLVYLDKFYDSFKILWHTENKAFGFEAHDIKIGGLIARINTCKKKLEKYIKGDISKIEEIEEVILDFETAKKEYTKKHVRFNSYRRTVSSNFIAW